MLGAYAGDRQRLIRPRCPSFPFFPFFPFDSLSRGNARCRENTRSLVEITEIPGDGKRRGAIENLAGVKENESARFLLSRGTMRYRVDEWIRRRNPSVIFPLTVGGKRSVREILRLESANKREHR